MWYNGTLNLDRNEGRIMTGRVQSKVVTAAAREALIERGVTIEVIGEIVLAMQTRYNPELTLEGMHV